MALPTGPIPRVAFEEIIEEDWGDSVAQSLNNIAESHDWLIWSPTLHHHRPHLLQLDR